MIFGQNITKISKFLKDFTKILQIFTVNMCVAIL
jgi:hypothetical protein